MLDGNRLVSRFSLELLVRVVARCALTAPATLWSVSD